MARIIQRCGALSLSLSSHQWYNPSAFLQMVMRIMADGEYSELYLDIANDWKNIPEEYWNMALAQMNVPD